MINNRMFMFAVAVTTALWSFGAHAGTTYKWLIYNNFYLYGNNIKQLEPSTCSGMTCPTITPTSVPYQTYASASADVTGQNPNGEVYVGYLWANGSKNECGFALSGGTVNADGSSTQPHAFAYLAKYTTGGANGATIYPGCPQNSTYVTTKCDDGGKNCIYTGYFVINQIN